MRNEARDPPTIGVIITKNPKRKLNGCYDHRKNVIGIAKLDDEDRVILTILHEMDHWAQYMFLTDKECKRVGKAYSKYSPEKDNGKNAPVIEKGNRFRAGGWGFPIDEEEEMFRIMGIPNPFIDELIMPEKNFI